ncbi:hypothetical protein Pelo_17225 [Pelomyxa schiedti]|nr:hypothetical protein Pelo_17225 [Pelomyxa schiedti]
MEPKRESTVTKLQVPSLLAVEHVCQHNIEEWHKKVEEEIENWFSNLQGEVTRLFQLKQRELIRNAIENSQKSLDALSLLQIGLCAPKQQLLAHRERFIGEFSHALSNIGIHRGVHIINLPGSVHSHILEYLPNESLLNLRLVCRTFALEVQEEISTEPLHGVCYIAFDGYTVTLQKTEGALSNRWMEMSFAGSYQDGKAHVSITFPKQLCSSPKLVQLTFLSEQKEELSTATVLFPHNKLCEMVKTKTGVKVGQGRPRGYIKYCVSHTPLFATFGRESDFVEKHN